MKATTRSEYGVRAMVALAKHYGSGPASITTISQESAVPAAYLEQLVASLKRADLVVSRRGAAGGYVLAKSPQETVIGEIYRAMEGPIAPMDCVSEDIADQICPLIPNCETRPVWLKVRDSIAETLDGITLADLLRDAPSQEPKAELVAS